MEARASDLRTQVEELTQGLSDAQRDLEQYVDSCSHKFSDPKYDPIRTESYKIHGDAPGTMGVDRRLPMFVPAKTENRWKRECGLCGEVQYTKKVNKSYEETPNFG